MIYGNAVMLGGGGGGITATDAILRVQAPAGSTVTISKGAVSKSDLGHENADDHTVYDYYFIIHQSQFDSVNPWTVTATLGGDTASDTIIINAANEYNFVISYNVPPEYQAVAYLEGTGTQWFMLSCTKANISCRMQYTATNQTIIGGSEGGSTQNARLAIGIADGYFAFFVGSNDTKSTLAQDTNVHDYQLTFSGTSGTLSLDGNTVYTKTNLSYSGTTSCFAMFGYVGYNRTTPASSAIAKVRIMNFIIEGQHELYPCYRKSDNVAGMWDKITETFYTNQGTGTFVVGGNI